MEYLFERSNIGLATAGATMMLMTTICIAVPFLYWQARRKSRAEGLG
jgi:glucose/mannose transport system permease protein